jgi:hypothetical protein
MNQFIQKATLSSAASAAVDYTSIPYALNGLTDASIHVVFSGTGTTGSLKLQGSNFAPADNHWVDIADSTQAVNTATDAQHIWNIEYANYEWIRFVWTHAAGTGVTLTAVLAVKGLQG